MKKSYVFYFILNLSMISSTAFITQLRANDELDKKIDIKDFGKFYPGTTIDTNNPTPQQSEFPKEITPNVFSRPSNNQAPVIKGAIRINNWVDDIPEFRVIFEGQESLTDENGFFSFPVDNNNLQKYKLIITRKILHAVDKKNTLANFKIIPDKNYLCYSFKKLEHNQGIWLQKEKKLHKKNFIIPKDSLVVLIDPKYIEKIEEWDVNLADNFIKLPRIVLKSTIDPDKLKRISAKSLLCFEDSVFHERAGRVTAPDAKNNKVKVTLP